MQVKTIDDMYRQMIVEKAETLVTSIQCLIESTGHHEAIESTHSLDFLEALTAYASTLSRLQVKTIRCALDNCKMTCKEEEREPEAGSGKIFTKTELGTLFHQRIEELLASLAK